VKKKVLLSFFVILLILALTGCGVTPELTTDKSLVEEAVYNYWQAIINRQYELAKCFCVIGGIWDNKVDEWEEYININSEDYCSFLVIYFDKFYKPTEVIGENAVVYVRIIADKIVVPCKKKDGDGIDIIDVFEYETELIKPNGPYGDWWALK
jgi:hypothetical protein